MSTILVVDDERTVRSLLHDVLEIEGEPRLTCTGLNTRPALSAPLWPVGALERAAHHGHSEKRLRRGLVVPPGASVEAHRLVETAARLSCSTR